MDERYDLTRCALAMMENLDANVGRALKRLDELKLADNTIVTYFSDNGSNGHRWTGGMKGTKGTTDEGAVRSVFFMRWPGDDINARTVVKEITGAIDLLPPLIEAGVKLVVSGPTRDYLWMPAKDSQPLAQFIGGAPQPKYTTFIQGTATRDTLTLKMTKLDGTVVADVTLKA